MKRFFIFALIMLSIGACTFSVDSNSENELPPAVAGTQQQQDDAFNAAKDIIHAIDRGQYSKVWDDSSDIIKNNTNKFLFTKMLQGIRGNLGKPKPRGNPSIGFASKIDHNLPEGEYCILIIDTDFNGKIVTERVVMQRVSEKWKLAGYFVSTKIMFSTGN